MLTLGIFPRLGLNKLKHGFAELGLLCACGAPAWISSKGAFRRSAKCQAAASMPTIRGEVVIAAATCLICGNDRMIY